MREKFGKPVEQDQFADPSATLPIIVKAAYNPVLNGFEIPAATLQAPMFEADMDAPWRQRRRRPRPRIAGR